MSSFQVDPPARCPPKFTPLDSMTVMDDLSYAPQVEFPLLGEKSVRDNTPRHAPQSLRGEQILDRLLTILSSNLESEPTSNVTPFPPSLLFAICDTLQSRECAPGSQATEHHDASVLPSVLNKLRNWRLLDPAYRHSPEGVQNLALDLASIMNEPSTNTDRPPRSSGRLRMKWVSSDLSVESQDREPLPSPSCVLNKTQEWAHAHTSASERSADTVPDHSCQADGLGILGFENTRTGASRRHHSVAVFRSGCAACHHPRVSSTPCTPRTPQVTFSEQSTLSGDRGLSEVHITPSSRRTKSISQNSSTKSKTRKTKQEKPRPLQSLSRGVEVDENEPPLARSITGNGMAQQGISISFPRQRIHPPPTSNAISSHEYSSTSSPVASTKGILQPSHVPNHTREDDKRMSSHRIPSVNVDLRLPIGASRASPMDLHSPTRAQSLSYTLHNGDLRVHPHGTGSVDGVSNPKPTRKETGSGSRSRKRPERLLPFWSPPHPTTSSKPASSSSSSLPRSVKGSSPILSTRPSSSLPRTKTPSDAKDRLGPSVTFEAAPTQCRSTFKFPSPPLQSRKWLASP